MVTVGGWVAEGWSSALNSVLLCSHLSTEEGGDERRGTREKKYAKRERVAQRKRERERERGMA